jgi:hypothetical protein
MYTHARDPCQIVITASIHSKAILHIALIFSVVIWERGINHRSINHGIGNFLFGWVIYCSFCFRGLTFMKYLDKLLKETSTSFWGIMRHSSERSGLFGGKYCFHYRLKRQQHYTALQSEGHTPHSHHRDNLKSDMFTNSYFS